MKLRIHIEILLKICQNNTVHSHQSSGNAILYCQRCTGGSILVILKFVRYAGGIDYERDRYTGP